MSNITTRKQDLEAKVAELEEALAQVKAQLRDEREKDEHEEIDRLDEYLDQIDNKYANLKDFWSIVREELAELFSSNNDKNQR
ncbi:hypothetical protein Q7C_1845 [Methylophaga frappieri]|uniref:Uncharacterized protein n=1 Tax=Methylophaga frappieri (strain ATCC BAA-2434 / DSM 25690 / JAM7) TaxID=754477 RepID=I1YJ93_METFJ|nr:hypothetical protein [Methylophaga frappieri]AFJ02986.1 hypothetical protein Q7C_1845 [Methylophaga frappieri]